MPTFDIVSEVDMHEMTNAVDQAAREIGNRFDFKGIDAEFNLNGDVVAISAEVDFQIHQMLDVLQNKMVKRGIDIACLKTADVELVGQKATMQANVQQGIESETARSIVKKVKEKKMKVQIAIQGDKLRVTGKKRDDLQAVIAMLKEENYGLPLQFNNFRD
ncbi:MAG: YajQ family cyclic di-GMP-binding protein [Gammaproteobacteria bacterium]|nr:YajQ family cyclic di-GMP-binding protein [Gammaproteobacteria bacterium]